MKTYNVIFNLTSKDYTVEATSETEAYNLALELLQNAVTEDVHEFISTTDIAEQKEKLEEDWN